MIIWRATWLHCWISFNLQLLLAALPTSNQVAIWWKTSRRRFLRDFQRFRKRFSNRSNFTTRNDSELPGTWRKVLHYLLRWLETHTASPTTTIRSFVFPPYLWYLFLFLLPNMIGKMWCDSCDIDIMLSLLAAKQALQRGQSSSRAREALRLGARKLMRGCIICWGGGNAFFFEKKFTPIFWGKWSEFSQICLSNGWGVQTSN